MGAVLFGMLSFIQDGDTKTLVIQCPTGSDTSKCGFPTPVTVTAGPSTVALITTIGGTMTVDLKCGIDGSTKASCTQTYTGPASLHTTGDGIDGAKTTTWIASQNIDSGKVTYIPVTVTAGLSSGTSSSTSKKNSGAEATRVAGQMVAAGLFANFVGHLY